MQRRVSAGRTRRLALRGLGLGVVAWVAATAGAVLQAPAAEAAPTATVEIRDLTPPLVSIDPGGQVTFTNDIADKDVQVGGGGLLPSLVTVVVHTDVSLRLPSGDHPLQPGQSVTERFPQSCLGQCAITYTYRAAVPGTSLVGSALDTVVGKALATLPQNQVLSYDGQQTTVTLGVPTPFLVNTLVPLPNLPSVDLPQLPPLTVPAPQAPVAQPAPATPAQPAPPVAQPQAPQPAGQPAPQPAPAGTGYTYRTGSGAAALAPTAGRAAAAFDPARVGAGASGDGAGAGGVAGTAAGTTAAPFGRLASLDTPAGATAGDGTTVAPDAAGRTSAATLSLPALAAVVALAGVSSALLRVQRAHRAGR